MRKLIFFFLHPKAISAAELRANGKLSSLCIAGRTQVACEFIEELDKFCDAFLDFYHIELLTDLDARYFIIDAGARQEIRSRFSLNFKRCTHVSSLSIEEALPFVLMRKGEVNFSSPLNISYCDKSYRLVSRGDAMKLEFNETSSQNESIAISDEDFLTLVQPAAIQRALLKGYQDKLKRANAQIVQLYENIQFLREKVEKPRKLFLGECTPGNIIWFGTYAWLVLEQRNGRALLITRDAIEQYRFDGISNNWEKSEIRAYLNGYFYNKTFTLAERELIIETELVTEGTITKDRIFLLSVEEAQHYLTPKEVRICLLEGHSCCYWLRTPGASPHCVTFVRNGGSISRYGLYVYAEPAVRPALWLNLES